ncbi:MAG: MotA/TolQ/ExbB proton channel family protein [Hyphomonadaceae bacterium]|nr:MotA/TolQ/ExbB proton channel family protein [Hyphomonadaceae bacterium]MBC6411532.1 MotA/TolQ/ExbB proton channel family protein [Hyphomonadaceae bacterium]
MLKGIAATVVAASVMLTAVPANGQVTSIQSVLDQVRENAQRVEQENRQREAEFRQRRDEQAALLAQARAELAALERRSRVVQNQSDANQANIDVLAEELRLAQGDFGEVFGLARAKAAEFKAMLDSSLISSQYPARTEVLGRVAESKALPSTDDLNTIWENMLREIRAQREIATYDAPVANVEDGASQSVTRVGPFAVFTADTANFLAYKAPGESGGISLAKLPRQPGGAISKAARRVAAASDGELVYAPLDPTRGSLLASFERVPTVTERVGRFWLFEGGFGGTVGVIIQWILALGIVLGLLKIISLLMTFMAVGAQKRKAQASRNNPLGRIMTAYDNARNDDAETVELVLDEAILKESPKLERGLNLLKLSAGIAPLLGLLGTVTGMIKTFQAMMIYGTGDPQLMAGGISEALVTTMLGLIAAIPLLVLHSICSSLARGVQSTLEEQSAGIVARHVESRG